MELPVHHITTQKRWDDIVLNASTPVPLNQLRDWLQQHKELFHSKNELLRGYRALFYDPRFLPVYICQLLNQLYGTPTY
jgi:hypothetical protein